MSHTAARPPRRTLVAVATGLLLAITAWGMAAIPASAAGTTLALSKSGAAVPDDGTVTTGDLLTATITGFAPNTSVLLQFGDTQLPQSITTDSKGAGASAIKVPTVASSVYLMTAIGLPMNATTSVVVQNSASPVPVETAAAAVVPAATPSSSANLAKTGSTPLPAGLSGLLLVLIGAACLRLGAAAVVGRHERRGGAHLAR